MRSILLGASRVQRINAHVTAVTASTIGILRSSAGPQGKRDHADYLIVSVSTDDAREGRLGVLYGNNELGSATPKSSLVIRLLLAVWITVVVVVLCATGRWWGLVFVVPLVLDLYLLRRILAAGSGR
jgi:hypothetical protein